MIARLSSAALWRAGALLFVVAAIGATAVRVKSDRASPAQTHRAPETVAARPDPIQAELIHCQGLGEAAANDAACLWAWTQNRRRFFDLGAPAKAPPKVVQAPDAPVAISSPPSSAPLPVEPGS